MRWPSGDSKTTEQKFPVARDMCSATIPSSASISGTASLNASAAAPSAPARLDSSAGFPPGGPDARFDTMQLYSGVLGKCLLYGLIWVQTAKTGSPYPPSETNRPVGFT